MMNLAPSSTTVSNEFIMVIYIKYQILLILASVVSCHIGFKLCLCISIFFQNFFVSQNSSTTMMMTPTTMTMLISSSSTLLGANMTKCKKTTVHKVLGKPENIRIFFKFKLWCIGYYSNTWEHIIYSSWVNGNIFYGKSRDSCYSS